MRRPSGYVTTASARRRSPSTDAAASCIVNSSPGRRPDFSRMVRRIISPHWPCTSVLPLRADVSWRASRPIVSLRSMSERICSLSEYRSRASRLNDSVKAVSKRVKSRRMGSRSSPMRCSESARNWRELALNISSARRRMSSRLRLWARLTAQKVAAAAAAAATTAAKIVSSI